VVRLKNVGAPRPCLCPAGVLPGGSFRRIASRENDASQGGARGASLQLCKS